MELQPISVDRSTLLTAWLKRDGRFSNADVGSLARKLDALDVAASKKHHGQVMAKFVRNLIAFEKLRDEFLPVQLSADPGWSILLDLTAAALELRQVSVSSLCIAANVPTSTALRWISNMVTDGLLERQADPKDSRRRYISLSPQMLSQMLLCLSKMQRRMRDF